MNTISTKKWGYMVAALAAGVAFCPAQAEELRPHKKIIEGGLASEKLLHKYHGENEAEKTRSLIERGKKFARENPKAAAAIAAGLGIVAALGIGFTGHSLYRANLARDLGLQGALDEHAPTTLVPIRRPWGKALGIGFKEAGSAWRAAPGRAWEAGADWFRRQEYGEPPRGNIGGQGAENWGGDFNPGRGQARRGGGRRQDQWSTEDDAERGKFRVYGSWDN